MSEPRAESAAFREDHPADHDLWCGCEECTAYFRWALNTAPDEDFTRWKVSDARA